MRSFWRWVFIAVLPGCVYVCNLHRGSVMQEFSRDYFAFLWQDLLVCLIVTAERLLSLCLEREITSTFVHVSPDVWNGIRSHNVLILIVFFHTKKFSFPAQRPLSLPSLLAASLCSLPRVFCQWRSNKPLKQSPPRCRSFSTQCSTPLLLYHNK